MFFTQDQARLISDRMHVVQRALRMHKTLATMDHTLAEPEEGEDCVDILTVDTIFQGPEV